MSTKTNLTEINDEAEIPEFASEAEEAKFWDTHALSEKYIEAHPPVELDWLPPPRLESTSVAIRFDRHTLERLKALALRKHKRYQTLLKEFVTERLYEEEKREGLVGGGTQLKRPSPPKDNSRLQGS